MSSVTSQERKPTVLVLCDYYLPGFRGGGPVRSVSRIVSALSHRFTFRIITRDRDVGAPQPYAGVPLGNWHPCGKAEIFYVRPRAALPMIARAITSTPHDVLYLNSLFSPQFSITPLLVRKVFQLQSRVLISPRGELDRGALTLKPSGRLRTCARREPFACTATWYGTRHHLLKRKKFAASPAGTRAST